jgi:hypothetical protein
VPETSAVGSPAFSGKRLAAIEGLVGAVAVDLDRGSIDGIAGSGPVGDLELAAIQDGQVLDRVREVASLLAPDDELHSVVMSIADHHYVILPSRRVPGRYLYLVVERGRTPLGLLLHRLAEASGS